MKKIYKFLRTVVLSLMFLSLPTLTFSIEGSIHSLDSYRIYNIELCKNIYTFIIPFLINERYLSSENVIDITFDSNSFTNYIHVSIEERQEILWTNNIIGYANFAGYTCILRGNNYNKFIKRTILKCPKKFVFNNPKLPYCDGTIEWLFRLEGEKIKFVRFNSEW